jgi:acyl dehydratase
VPLDANLVGQTTAPVQHSVDARWLMAYAAGIADYNPRYLDTAAGEVIAHPVFPVCAEWPAVLATRALQGYASATPAELARGVHASHDLHISRPIRAGDELTTRATVISVRQIKPGAAQMTRLDTVDATGELVCRTFQLGISRDVAVLGADRAIEDAPATPARPERGGELGRFPIAVPQGAAHVYTECARIWNPIHTDRAVALAAGLPDIILHGTATLALAVTQLVDRYLAGDPTQVRRLGGRFAGMVLMPSAIELRVHADADATLFFTVMDAKGQVVFNHGFLCYG